MSDEPQNNEEVVEAPAPEPPPTPRKPRWSPAPMMAACKRQLPVALYCLVLFYGFFLLGKVQNAPPSTVFAHASLIGVQELPKPAMPEPPPTQEVAPALPAQEPAPTIAPAQDTPKPLGKIALVVQGFGGQSPAVIEAAKEVPAPVAFAYFSATPDLNTRVRETGHEYLLMLPMEPMDYAANDPGLETLLTGLPPAENLRRLEGHLQKCEGYIGVCNFMGSRFAASKDDFEPVARSLQERGIGFFDAGASPRSIVQDLARVHKMRFAKSTIQIDRDLDPEIIQETLKELEVAANRDGYAIGFGKALPLTLRSITQWSQGLKDRGVELVPLSQLMIEGGQE